MLTVLTQTLPILSGNRRWELPTGAGPQRVPGKEANLCYVGYFQVAERRPRSRRGRRARSRRYAVQQTVEAQSWSGHPPPLVFRPISVL